MATIELDERCAGDAIDDTLRNTDRHVLVLTAVPPLQLSGEFGWVEIESEQVRPKVRDRRVDPSIGRQFEVRREQGSKVVTSSADAGPIVRRHTFRQRRRSLVSQRCDHPCELASHEHAGSRWHPSDEREERPVLSPHCANVIWAGLRHPADDGHPIDPRRLVGRGGEGETGASTDTQQPDSRPIEVVCERSEVCTGSGESSGGSGIGAAVARPVDGDEVNAVE
jgi:hypothetical protein